MRKGLAVWTIFGYMVLIKTMWSSILRPVFPTQTLSSYVSACLPISPFSTSPPRPHLLPPSPFPHPSLSDFLITFFLKHGAIKSVEFGIRPSACLFQPCPWLTGWALRMPLTPSVSPLVSRDPASLPWFLWGYTWTSSEKVLCRCLSSFFFFLLNSFAMSFHLLSLMFFSFLSSKLTF